MIDSIIYNAKIHTIDATKPEAEAVAIKNGKIEAIGNNDQILGLAGQKTELTDAGNHMILPGFIDSHLHLAEGSERLFHIKLREAKSKAEFQSAFKENIKNYKKNEWILGGDWNHENWDGELPEKNWIDSITPDNPVWVKRLDGHMGLANSNALKFCGISETSQNTIEGGEIVYKNGQTTGIFKDRAMELIEKNLPEKSFIEKENSILKGITYLSERGVTSCHYLNLFAPIDIDVFEQLKNQNKLNCRIYISFPLEDMKRLEEHIKMNGKGNEWIKYGILKAFLDGSLGSQTAAFFENYKGSHKNGLFVTEFVKMQRLIEMADLKGFQIAIHAIGNKANHILLNMMEEVAAKNGPRDRRFRIEHAQHVNLKDIQRFGKLKIIASMQPLHLHDDGCWAHKMLDDSLLEGSFPFNDLLNTNACLSFGSDWFVAEPSPLLGIYAAATRQTSDGKHSNGWIAKQKITVSEAVKAYTINAAYASFEENIKGSLSIGKLADFVMLDKNILEIDPVEIKNTKVIWTVVGGKTVYSNFSKN